MHENTLGACSNISDGPTDAQFRKHAHATQLYNWQIPTQVFVRSGCTGIIWQIPRIGFNSNVKQQANTAFEQWMVDTAIRESALSRFAAGPHSEWNLELLSSLFTRTKERMVQIWEDMLSLTPHIGTCFAVIVAPFIGVSDRVEHKIGIAFSYRTRNFWAVSLLCNEHSNRQIYELVHKV